MTTADLILAIVGIWTYLGFVFFVQSPKPKTDRGATLQTVACGPAIWLMWIFLAILEYFDARKRRG